MTWSANLCSSRNDLELPYLETDSIIRSHVKQSSQIFNAGKISSDYLRQTSLSNLKEGGIMPIKKWLVPIAIAAGLICVLALACSDSSTNNEQNPSGLDITLSSYTALVEAIAPPRFEGGSGLAKPAIMDSVWLYGYNGEYPLLGKVFGEDEPMSLYRNLDVLDETIDMINSALESGTDTLTEQEGGETYHGAVLVEEIDGPIEIPEQCQAVLGAEPLTLDYHVAFNIIEMPEMDLEAGIQVTATEEQVICYQRMPTAYWDPEMTEGTESNLFWATRNLTTDAVEIRCVFYKDYGDSTCAIWVYNIKTVGESDFQYRMSWYSNEESVPEGMLGCIIGGGNKDEQFALRYRDFNPPETPYNDVSQLFGPNYSDEGDVTEEFEDYVDDTNFFGYEDLPTEILSNPLDAADLINPWNEP